MSSFVPPYGLSGGSLRFDPGSLLLITDDPIRNYRFFDPAVEGSVRLEGQSADDFDDRARVFHERDHLLRQLCSSFGIVRHSVVSQLATEALLYLGQVPSYLPHEAPLMVGFSELRERTRGFGVNTDKLIGAARSWAGPERHLLKYLALLQFLKALDGDPLEEHAELAELGLGLFDSKLVHTSNFKAKAGRYVSVFDQESVPLWHPVGNQELSSRDIFEAFAVECESVYAVRMGRDPSNPTNLVDFEHYRRIAVLAVRLFSHIRERHLPLEVDAALDLALWIPMTLRGNWFSSRPWTWFDLEPGHRLGKIFEWMKGRPKTDFHYAEDGPGEGLEYCDAAYKQFQRAACQALGWPTPWELADGLIEELEELNASRQTNHGFAILGEPSPRIDWSLRLLRRYRKEPFSVFYPTFSVHDDSGTPIWFPAGIFSDSDFQMTGMVFDRDRSHWNEYQILTGLRMMIEGPVEHPMPRHHAVEGLRLIGPYGSGLLDDSGFEDRMRDLSRAVAKLPDGLPPFSR